MSSRMQAMERESMSRRLDGGDPGAEVRLRRCRSGEFASHAPSPCRFPRSSFGSRARAARADSTLRSPRRGWRPVFDVEASTALSDVAEAAGDVGQGGTGVARGRAGRAEPGAQPGARSRAPGGEAPSRRSRSPVPGSRHSRRRPRASGVSSRSVVAPGRRSSVDHRPTNSLWLTQLYGASRTRADHYTA